MNPHAPLSYLDLHRLSDYALDQADLPPLMQALADDLEGQIQALMQALERGDDDQALHRILHAIKGMAGMFATPGLVQSVTRADDACRQGDRLHGEAWARSLLPDLSAWSLEVRGWLQRYS